MDEQEIFQIDGNEIARRLMKWKLLLKNNGNFCIVRDSLRSSSDWNPNLKACTTINQIENKNSHFIAQSTFQENPNEAKFTITE